MSVRSVFTVLAGVLALSAVAGAATLYSNFNTVEVDYLGSFYSMGPYVSGADSFPAQVSHIANAFTLPAGPGITSYQLNAVQMGMSLFDGTNEVTISIVGNDNDLPDADDVLGSVTITGQMAAYWAPGIIHADFGANPVTLTPGKEYWLVAAPGQNDTAAIWHYNYAPDLVWNNDWESYDIMDNWLVGDVAWFDGNQWQRAVHTDPMGSVPPNDALSAFSLEGSPVGVPEPALAGIVIGPALCGLGLRRRVA